MAEALTVFFTKKNQFEIYDSDHRTKFDIALLNWLQ